MSLGVQFEEESFKPGERQIIEEKISSPLVRFLVQHKIVKSKNIATVVIIVLVVVIFIVAFFFIVLGEMQIQPRASVFTPVAPAGVVSG